MIKYKAYLVIVVSNLFLVQQVYTMDGMSLRNAIWEKFPKINEENSHFMGCMGGGVLTYHDNNYVQKFLDLTGKTTTVLDEKREDIHKIINKSILVKTGHWRLSEEDNFISTGNVHECVAIAIQHKNPNLVAMYHYYQKADQDFVILDTFLSAIKNKADTLAINVPNFSTVLVSSYLSANLLIIKQMMEENAFNVKLSYIRPRAFLAKDLFVHSTDIATKPGRLILASPSVLRVHEYDDLHVYDSDLPVDDEECIIS